MRPNPGDASMHPTTSRLPYTCSTLLHMLHAAIPQSPPSSCCLHLSAKRQTVWGPSGPESGAPMGATPSDDSSSPLNPYGAVTGTKVQSFLLLCASTAGQRPLDLPQALALKDQCLSRAATVVLVPATGLCRFSTLSDRTQESALFANMALRRAAVVLQAERAGTFGILPAVRWVAERPWEAPGGVVDWGSSSYIVPFTPFFPFMQSWPWCHRPGAGLHHRAGIAGSPFRSTCSRGLAYDAPVRHHAAGGGAASPGPQHSTWPHREGSGSRCNLRLCKGPRHFLR